MGGILVAKSYISGHLAQLQMDQKIWKMKVHPQKENG